MHHVCVPSKLRLAPDKTKEWMKTAQTPPVTTGNNDILILQTKLSRYMLYGVLLVAVDSGPKYFDTCLDTSTARDQTRPRSSYPSSSPHAPNMTSLLLFTPPTPPPPAQASTSQHPRMQSAPAVHGPIRRRPISRRTATTPSGHRALHEVRAARPLPPSPCPHLPELGPAVVAHLGLGGDRGREEERRRRRRGLLACALRDARGGLGRREACGVDAVAVVARHVGRPGRPGWDR